MRIDLDCDFAQWGIEFWVDFRDSMFWIRILCFSIILDFDPGTPKG